MSFFISFILILNILIYIYYIQISILSFNSIKYLKFIEHELKNFNDIKILNILRNRDMPSFEKMLAMSKILASMTLIIIVLNIILLLAYYFSISNVIWQLLTFVFSLMNAFLIVGVFNFNKIKNESIKLCNSYERLMRNYYLKDTYNAFIQDFLNTIKKQKEKSTQKENKNDSTD